MKRIFKTFLVLSIASLTVISACKKDEDEVIPNVSVTITPSPTGSIQVGDVLTLTIQGVGYDKNKLSEITVTRTGRSTPLIDNKKVSGTALTEVIRDTPNTAGSYTYTVTLKGEKNTATADYAVTVTAQPTYTNFTNVTPQTLDLGAQASSLAQFVDLHTFITYEFGNGDAKANSSKIDLGMAYGTANGASLFAPSNTTFDSVYKNGTSNTNGIYTWGTRNATKLFKATGLITKAQFDAATNDSIIQAHGSGFATSTGLVNLLAANDIIFYQTAKSPAKYGMIYIVSVTPNTTGGMSVTYKVAQ